MYKYKLFSFIFVMISIFVVFLQIETFVFSQTETPTPTPEDKSKRSEELQKEIEGLSNKLSETRSKKASLTNQIAYMDTQIRITQLEIQRSAARIEEMKVPFFLWHPVKERLILFRERRI
ncbi:MAG: hypothetical protein UU14_C0002G0047 [Candidatus Roizmanbacteria bacterium GW2011_GWB1_40_7]|uniref:Uncharacterized protein n=2 Tax=Candidatus Roizmaniibacteriota TaxID=1752723 RepID=A0A0G0T713_9BACT|nr:MAG: hypothetical protein UU14_C0002G0047 [Candidatus Roizmanbacteria bacterium GW2011_GWB1_40_7]